MNSIDVTQENFESAVIDRSRTVPVVVDFWAEWCQPCQILKPLLESLASEYQGKFILAKINVEENQALAAEFGVKGIPSVKAISDGKLVNEFSGVLPEPEIRKFLEQLFPNESEELRLHAQTILESGDSDAALKILDRAMALDDSNYRAYLDKAEIYLRLADLDGAESLLKKLPLTVHESEPQASELKTKIDIARRRVALPDKQTLLAKIDKNAHDLQAKVDLANVYVAEQQYSPALDLLFEVIEVDKNFADGIARKTMIDIFNLMGSQDKMIREARKKLSRLLN